MNIIEEVKNFVKEESYKPSSKYGHEPFEHHFVPMVKYALALSDELGGDREIIAISAWLHDIGSIMHGRKDHHVTGAEIAEKKLREWGYPEEKIILVKNCILHHRGSQNFEQDTIEEQIISEADAISNFDNIAGIFKAAFVIEKLDQGEAKISVREKLERKWKQLHFEKSKQLIRPKYEAIMLILQ